MSWSSWIAVSAGGLLLAGWVGYPLALGLLATLARRRNPRAVTKPPDLVSVIIATRESPDFIRQRLLNLHSCELGGIRLEIVVGVDPGSRFPLAAYQAVSGEYASFVSGDLPGGKACTLNAAVRSSTAKVLVFTDSLQRFDRNGILNLLARFQDPTVGAVTGTYEFGDSSSTHGLIRGFWAYELLLRRLESEVDSVVAVTGAIYALRREHWVELPAGLICDDLFVPMQVVRQGRRVVADFESLAFDDRRFGRAEEFRRKVRTLTGMIQFCVFCPWALLPIRNRIWGQFVCHKLLRLATPYLVLVSLTALVASWTGPTGTWFPFAMLLLGITIVLTLAPPLRDHLTWAGYLLVAPVVATLNAIRGKWDVWTAR